MTSSSLKNKPSKLKTSKSKDEELQKRPKDSMIINRQRLAKVDKSKSNSTSISEEDEEEIPVDSNEDADSGSNDEAEGGKDEENDWESESNSNSDDDDDSNENSSEEDKLDESTYKRLVSQLRPEDMTEQELLLLAQRGIDSPGEDSQSEGSEGGSQSGSESGSEVGEEEESDIDLEEEEDEAIEGIEYEKMHVDSDNEDLGAMVQRKVVKNNTKALGKLLDLMKDKSSLQLDFFETQTIQSTSATQVPDVNDDIGLEVELYKQALQGAKEAYQTFQKSSKEFFRPDDYFAEMIKSDAHMEKIRLKLISEMENIKASEDSKKKRDLKKFGKAIQVEKKLEREKESKRVKEGVKELRKKRKDVPLGTNEVDFDIALEETLSNKRNRNDKDDDNRGSKKKPKLNRIGREHKFGRPKPKGVTGRRWKENNKESSSNFEGMGGKGDGKITSGRRGGRGARGGRGGARSDGGGRGGSKRPGKSVRSSKR